MAPGPALSVLAHELKDPGQIPLSKKIIKLAPASLSTGTKVLDASLITTEFDLLRFEAAAYGQLQVAEHEHSEYHDHHVRNDKIVFSTLLISSPYNNPGHYLDLTDLDISNLIFSKALTALKPVRLDYATAPYTEALNFPTVLELIRKFSKDERQEWKEQSFYVVVFRSKLKEGVDNDLLYKLDYESHGEACESGGLLKYWFGKPNEERRNLATCKWCDS